MKTITINNKTVKLYESIDEMPIVNFQKYNKCVLIDSGIGSDIDAVDSHVINIAKYLTSSKSNDKALQELQNMRKNLHMIVSEISPKYMAFAALVHSINGIKNTDLSDTRLAEILTEIRDIPHGVLVDILEGLKKKLSNELEVYFPSEFDNAKEKEVYSQLKQRILLQLQEIIDEVDNSEKISDIDSFFFSLHKPKVFDGKESEEIKYDKQFESACILISQKLNMNAKAMTVFEFYSAMASISKQIEADKKAYSKHRKRT